MLHVPTTFLIHLPESIGPDRYQRRCNCRPGTSQSH